MSSNIEIQTKPEVLNPLFKVYNTIFVVTWKRGNNEGFITVASEREARQFMADFNTTHETEIYAWYSTGFMQKI